MTRMGQFPITRNENYRTITARDVGKVLEGLGRVMAGDIGKQGYMRPGGLQWESAEQVEARAFKQERPVTIT